MGKDAMTYSIDEAAGLLGVSRGSAFKAARLGEIPVIRIGHRMLVPKAALDKLLREGFSSGGYTTYKAPAPPVITGA